MIERSLEVVSTKSWDVVIVGAGTIGLVVASIFVERGFSVLCLDSGGKAFDAAIQDLNKSILVGEKHLGISDARARVIGGTSTLWGGQLARFSKLDFSREDEEGNKIWPINYEDLEPWYKKVADILGVTGYDNDHNKILNQIFNDDIPCDDDIEFYATHWLRVPNIYSYYKAKINSEIRFCVCPNAHVVGINYDQPNRKVSSLSVSTSQGKVINIKSKIFVMANGTIEISRLLLSVAEKDNSVPWSDNKYIGRFFQDHLDVETGPIQVGNEARLAKYFENAIVDGTKVQPKIRLKNLTPSQEITNIGGSVRFESKFAEDIDCMKTMVKSFLRNDADFSQLSKIPSHINGIAKVWWPLAWKYMRHRRIMAFFDGGVFFRAHMEQAALYESKISIDARSLDRFEMPRVVLDWRIDWHNQSIALKQFCEKAKIFFSKNDFGEFFPKQEILDLDIDFLKRNYRDSFHQCGGAIMSNNRAKGVVDTECKVHGVDNLHICGAAVFPTSSYANPTFTAMALATKFAYSKFI